MYLKTLELQGFKSFPDKTVLRFDRGSTVIVGPNGSGKSNITDAMRWVLGELSTKTLRGSKMEDVIFIGTEDRKPMSYAEVSVTFDNTAEEGKLNSPYDEITVTRRYYRAGESEYLINRKPVRLKDIFELFMNTGVGREGYSIIGQGRIAEIISKKSEDRRSIFEEAAGISKFRYKKEEAERKLARTEENMQRAGDILRELESRVGPLERDSEKAKKYLELYGKKKEADISLWLYDSEKMREDIEKLESDYLLSTHELEMATDTVEQLEAKNDRLYNASVENKQKAEKLYGEIRESNNIIRELDSEYRVMTNDAEHNRASLKTETEETERLTQVLETIKHELVEKDDRLTTLTQELSGLEADYTAMQEKQNALLTEKDSASALLEELLEEQKAKESEASDLNVRISVLKNSADTSRERDDSVKRDIEKYRAEAEALSAQINARESTILEYQIRIEELEADIAKMDADLTENADILEALRRKESELSSQIHANRDLLDSLKRLEEHFEGYNHSVRFLMRAYEEKRLNTNHGEIFGPVSRLIDVPEQYTVAVETALGAGLQNIVVDNEETAKLCIRELKQAGAGRATFYPITSVKPSTPTQELKNAASFKGYVSTADKLISYDSKFSNIISSLLGRTAVFDQLDNATAAAKALRYTVRIVTLDGQQINVGGSFTGGSAKRDSGMLTRNAKIADLSKQIDTDTAAIEDISNQISSVKSDLDSLTSKRNLTLDTVRITETLRHSEEIQSESLKTQLDVAKNLLSGLVSDSEALESDREKSSEDIERLDEALRALRAEIHAISEKRQTLDEKRYSIAEAIDHLSDEIASHRIRTAEHKKDMEAAQLAILEANNRYAETEEQLMHKEHRIVYLKESINNSSTSTEDNRRKYAKESMRLERLEAERAQMDADGMELERKINELRMKIREVTSRKETVLLSHSKLENKLEQLKTDFEKTLSHLWDEYEITHSEAIELNYPPVTTKNRGEVASALAEYKKKIKALGPINVDAIEEYKTVKERYDVLSTQMNDLTKAKTELIKAIATLEVDMKDSFVTAFQAINLNFNEVFRELFGGGHAEVSLTDPENVLECGIEIKAAPPGKVIKSLMLLSGGEQAFVAIALLFAILKVNPTPFCIFDEIEAALDEVNVVRFGNYIKKYSDQTQFIVITHRRGTMEVADTLYGVTMPQHGVSRVLTMDVNDVGKEKILN